MKKKIFFLTASVIFLLIAFVSTYTYFSVSQYSDELAASSKRVASRGVFSYIESYERHLSTATNVLSNDPRFIQIARRGDHDELLSFLTAAKSKMGVDFFSVFNHEGRVLLRTHDPERYGDIPPNRAFELAQMGRYLATYYSSPTTPLSIARSVPLHHNDEFIGMLMPGILLSAPEFIDSMSARFGAQLTFYYDDRAVASTFPEFRYDMGFIADASITNAVLQNGGYYTRGLTIGGTNYSLYYFPLINSNNETIGMMSVAFSREYVDAMDGSMLRVIISLSITAVAVSISLLLIAISQISKPIAEANKRIQLMFDASPIAMFFYDNKLNALDCNTKALELFKFANKKYALEHYNDPLPPTQPNGVNSHEAADALMHEALKTGAANSEFMLQRVDGTPLPVELHYVRIKHNDADAVTEYITDLTNLKISETKVYEAHRFNQIILDSAPLMIAIWNSNFDIEHVNQQALDILQVADQQQFKRVWLDISPEFQPCGTASLEKTKAMLTQAFRDGFYSVEWILQTYIDKELVPMDMKIKKFNHHGEDFLLGYGIDLRPIVKAVQFANEKERKAEQAAQETVAKSRFLAQISHEIRTPMNAVLGIVEIQLQNDSLSTELKESLSHVRNLSYHLLAIINNLLDMSKAEAGKMEIIHKPYETISLIVNAVQVNMFYMGSKRIEFKVHVDKNLPIGLIGDELRIKQVLNNTLSNAFKYTNEGSVELSLDIMRNDFAPPDEVSLVISVKDTGRGMSKSQIYRLFGEEYLRFNENDSIEGSGLGMIITSHLIDLMDGKIEVVSEPGEGTEITMRIPQKIVGEDVIGEEYSQKLRNFEFSQMNKYQVTDFIREPMPYGRVLVVDDIELNIYVAKGHLAPYEIVVDTALSGFETLNKINGGEIYDIIFMDHMMPEMDGMETVKILRDGGYKGFIVALTANALVGNVEIFLKQGFDDFISKPIDLKDLNRVLNKFIRDRHPEEAAKYKHKAKIDKTEIAGASASAEEAEQDPKMLEMFQSDAEHAIQVLRETTASEKDVKLFTITVHAMKSALAYIGENELSEDAAKLEVAGKNGDLDYIGSNISEFANALEALLDKFRLQEPKNDADSDVFEDMGYLARYLSEVEAACLDYDIDSAVAKVEALLEKPWKQEISEWLKKIRNMLYLDSDFDAALEAIKDFPVD